MSVQGRAILNKMVVFLLLIFVYFELSTNMLFCYKCHIIGTFQMCENFTAVLLQGGWAIQ